MRLILLHRFSQEQRQQSHAATFYDASLQMTLSARSERAFVYIAGHFTLMIALFCLYFINSRSSSAMATIPSLPHTPHRCARFHTPHLSPSVATSFPSLLV